MQRGIALSDKYELESGRVFLTGVQALVRVILDQHNADAAAGLRTASLVSGYQGSPLGGFDKEVARLRGLAEKNAVVLRPAVNEELGATAVWGSQIAATLPRPRYDGVVGYWYGKAPGLDRAADAIRHGNYVGAHPDGGAVALVGDDPACKSSTIPGSSESLLAALHLPVLVPGDIQETLDFGRHAVALSRASGLWAALKIATEVADSAGTAEVGLDRVRPEMPTLEWEGKPYVHAPSAHLLAPQSMEMERTMVGVRLDLARLYGKINNLDRVVIEAPGARLGIVSAGPTAHDVRRALADLGLSGADSPVRLLQVGMVHPLDRDSIRAFARGLDEILVVEEKSAFLEPAVRDCLYGGPDQPLVTGKTDGAGGAVIPSHGVLDADSIARAIAPRILVHHEITAVQERLDELDVIAARKPADVGAVRTPFFCSGCPHNSSLLAPDGEIVGAGIGCHTMVMLAGKGHGEVNGITQMGGEGAQWVGAAPFVDVPHFTQNLGDGTFHHSGSLAVRAAVAAGLNVTYKLLYNGTVAMTGGQDVEGAMSVPRIAQSLAAEGVKRVVITTEDPDSYAAEALPDIASVHPRRELIGLQRDLAKVEGVTVLIHDQACAAELRRARKRGLAPEPPQRVVINERVCEGCGDCGAKSQCLSVEPIETEFGRKTRINQTSCNKDFSCLQGDCPSFLTITSPKGDQDRAAVPMPPMALPRPRRRIAGEDVRVRMVGVGGTGVVTVNQVLSVAAMLEGLHTSGLDQTGLSQKAGPVVSDIHISTRPVEDGVTVPGGAADLLLGLDLVGTATRSNLRVAAPDRTIAVVSDSVTPTAPMIVDPGAGAPHLGNARAAIDAVTKDEPRVYLDAQGLTELLLGNAAGANVFLLGAALQAGALPVSTEAVEEALRLNGVAVDQNLAALAWGRAAVVDPVAVREAAADPVPAGPELSAADRALLERAAPDPGELRRLLSVRIPDLRAWGGARVARRYAEEVSRVRMAEAERVPDSVELAEQVARNLYKLLAYKDEYEVARLHLELLDLLPQGVDAKVHLHPPLFRALGLKRKIAFGRWFTPGLKALRGARRLRGTPFDPFGHAEVRRIERELPQEYLALVDATLGQLTSDTIASAIEIARLPELISGYEDIKLRGVETFRARAAELRRRRDGDAE